MDSADIPKVFAILERHYELWEAPVVTLVAQHTGDPFKVLVCALLSTRTRDETTSRVCKKLFKKVKGPADILSMSEEDLMKLIYPVGFYRTKAKHLRKLSREILKRYDGRVPDSLEELLKLPGVGRKVANLVLADGFGIPAICVDTHVHRITNRWCLIKTNTPLQTERELAKRLPKKYWIPINRLLVAFGQRVCIPTNPRCSVCPIERFCGKCL